MTPVLRIRATRRTVSHSCCRYFYKHTGRSNTTLLDSVPRAKTQHRTWWRHSAPAPPGPVSWSPPCRWPPATLRSDLPSIDHSWTKVWEWLPARTHISSQSAQNVVCSATSRWSQNTRQTSGAHQVVLQDRLVCDFCCCLKTPVETNLSAMKSIFTAKSLLEKVSVDKFHWMYLFLIYVCVNLCMMN